jgi:hypothetical protein
MMLFGLEKTETKDLPFLLSMALASAFRLSMIPHLDISCPSRIAGPNNFDLFAVWTFASIKHLKDRHDVGPVNKAIARYENTLSLGRAIIAGDFNNHVKWDKRGNPRNFRPSADLLDKLGMASVYHSAKTISLGEEADHTHFWRDRREDSPHNCHIDYIFAPKTWLVEDTEVMVGTYVNWCGNGLSDHVPLMTTFKPPPLTKRVLSSP